MKHWPDRLMDLCSEYWEWLLRTEPTYATYLGDFRYNHLLPEIGAEARHRQIQDLEKLHMQVQELQISAMGSRAGQRSAEEEQGAISAESLRIVLEDALDERRLGFHQWNVDQLMGPQTWFLELPNYHPRKCAKDYQDLLERYRAFPRYMKEYLDNLAEGFEERRTAPRVAVDRVIGQLQELLGTPPDKSPLMPTDERPAEVPVEMVAQLETAIRESVYPSYERMLDFLKGGKVVTVAPGDTFRIKPYPARDAVGLSALPGGEEAYQYRIRRHTTTRLTARQIHDVGLDLLRGIHAEMAEIAYQAGHEGDLAAFRQKISQDPNNFCATREELLDGYRAILADVDKMLPTYFGRLPKVECVVKPIEEFREKDCVAAYYYSPPDDFSRPGVYYANTYQPQTRPKYNMTALTVHEAVPGHHLQIALAMEQTDLPSFRRHAEFTAYVEGWALYTERLGVEMGAYRDDLSHFGMLTFQAWRAARLVVDTGIHALGWSREQAVQFFRDNVGLPEQEILNEVDRYIIWPGQALAYAVGMREILRLRERATKALGTRFDLRAFHDEILRFGAVPLSILDSIVGEFIEHQQAAATH